MACPSDKTSDRSHLEHILHAMSDLSVGRSAKMDKVLKDAHFVDGTHLSDISDKGDKARYLHAMSDSSGKEYYVDKRLLCGLMSGLYQYTDERFKLPKHASSDWRHSIFVFPAHDTQNRRPEAAIPLRRGAYSVSSSWTSPGSATSGVRAAFQMVKRLLREATFFASIW